MTRSDEAEPELRWRVSPEAAGERLDRHVADHLDVPRNQVQRWIHDGRVWCNGATAKASTHLSAGDDLRAAPPPRREDRLRPESGELRVLHEDEHLLVLDKPPGLVVHPGAGRPAGTLVHRLIGRYPEIAGVGGPGRPGIVHRLDRDTTGVLAVARTPVGYRGLAAAFAERRVIKRYLAVVHGTPPDHGVIRSPIGRHPFRRTEMAVREGGRPSLTRFRVVDRARFDGTGGLAVLEIDLATGRTHQIRVHVKSEGYPLIGDPIYGEARHGAFPGEVRAVLETFPRPALHAWRLGFRHPVSDRRMRFEAPIPTDLQELWRAVGRGARFP